MSRSGYVGLGNKIADEVQEGKVKDYMAKGLTEEEARAKLKPMTHKDVPRQTKYVRGRMDKTGKFSTVAKDVADKVVSY